jgi:hypothetical protein
MRLPQLQGLPVRRPPAEPPEEPHAQSRERQATPRLQDGYSSPVTPEIHRQKQKILAAHFYTNEPYGSRFAFPLRIDTLAVSLCRHSQLLGVAADRMVPAQLTPH